MKLSGLSLQRKNLAAQKDPDNPVDKLVSFYFHFQRLSLKYQYQASDKIVMEKTLVQSDIVSDTSVDTTGTNTVIVKSTDYEKSRVSV